jgi:UDP-N-acetylglucosamine pyrophosphorylase
MELNLNFFLSIYLSLLNIYLLLKLKGKNNLKTTIKISENVILLYYFSSFVRSEEFSPLKNSPDSLVDSPNSCRADLSELHKSWVINAGGKLEGIANLLLLISLTN